MMTLDSSKRNLLQQPLLEWLGPKLGRAKHDDGSAALPGSRPSKKDLSIVHLKIRIGPIPLEDRGHLVDHVGVARAGHAHVPLEAADLRGMRQIEGTNVPRRKASLPMKSSGLGMYP